MLVCAIEKGTVQIIDALIVAGFESTVDHVIFALDKNKNVVPVTEYVNKM